VIDGEHYWDGGLVSNTPLQYVIEYHPRRSHLVFQVDLFPARGPLPENLNEVTERDKDIRYSSRTRAGTDTLRQLHDLRHSINMLWERLPNDFENWSESCPAQRIPLRDYHGHRSTDLPSGARAGTIKGLRIRPSDNGSAVGARSLRCARNNNGCAVAGADAS
jgi:hypothetical protein